MTLMSTHPLWLMATLLGTPLLAALAWLAAWLARLARRLPRRNEDMVLTEHAPPAGR